MDQRDLEVTYHGEQRTVSTLIREQSDRWLVCLHGIQSHKALFTSVFDQPWATDFSVLALDFVGFGDSAKPTAFSYDIADQAGICRLVMHSLGIGQAHLIGHSLGGMVGTLLLEQDADRAASLVTMEGNLVLADCGASRTAAATPYHEFKDSYRDFIADIGRSESPSARQREAALRSVPAYAFHGTSASIVAWARHERLRTILGQAPHPRLFVYGAENADKIHVLPAGVRSVCIPETGHFMLAEQPEATLAAIGAFLTETC